VFFTDVLQCTIMVIGGIVVAIMSKCSHLLRGFCLFVFLFVYFL